jgi:hypothetical protein
MLRKFVQAVTARQSHPCEPLLEVVAHASSSIEGYLAAGRLTDELSHRSLSSLPGREAALGHLPSLLPLRSGHVDVVGPRTV